MEVVIRIPFLIFSIVDIQFTEKKPTWKFYTATDALPTTKRAEFINNKEFAKAVLDEKSETFVIYIVALEVLPRLAEMTMHPSQAAQIAALKQDEALTKVSPK